MLDGGEFDQVPDVRHDSQFEVRCSRPPHKRLDAGHRIDDILGTMERDERQREIAEQCFDVERSDVGVKGTQ